MAGQDFAHNAAPSHHATPSAGLASVLPIAAILFVAGACFSAGYWLGANDIEQTGNNTDVDAMEAKLMVKNAAIKLHQARIETLEEMAAQWKSKAGQGAHTKVGELSFYNDLPKQSVTPASVSAKKEPAALAKSKPVNIHPALPLSPKPLVKKALLDHDYRIQIASFRSASDAKPVQKKILKAGFPAFVQQVDLADKGQWFRVYAGPFASKASAQEHKRQIEQHMNLTGLLIRSSK
ncbi:MAG: SPOR domain-containing protein [Mariprofundus sp.]|nr:SPOR domain-containing protein [Mariprofundus sp.]